MCSMQTMNYRIHTLRFKIDSQLKIPLNSPKMSSSHSNCFWVLVDHKKYTFFTLDKDACIEDALWTKSFRMDANGVTPIPPPTRITT